MDNRYSEATVTIRECNKIITNPDKVHLLKNYEILDYVLIALPLVDTLSKFFDIWFKIDTTKLPGWVFRLDRTSKKINNLFEVNKN